VFGPDSSQELIFEQVMMPALEKFHKGVNVLVMAYGETGSGKTFTMNGGR